MDTPMWKKFWPEFEEVMKRRLDAGHRSYGDGSFARGPAELTRETEEEALDIIGWGFILWCRLRQLRDAIEDANLEAKATAVQLEMDFEEKE